MRDSVHRKYTTEWLQLERPQPMYDKSINLLYDRFYINNPVHTENLDKIFIEKLIKYLNDHNLNSFKNIDNFDVYDICIGCTQFIDDIYQKNGVDKVQILENDYKYHWRLNNSIEWATINTLDPDKELIIAMPFPYYGDVHPNMDLILDICFEKKIQAHIDAAWISCCKDISFDFGHPAIKSFCVSLSKGGLGGNRIGVRFSKQKLDGPITIMNDFNMNNQSLVSLGIAYIDEIGPEYFWKKYEKAYYKVCKDFDLMPTKAIHLARFSSGQPVGVRPLLRCLI